jgi:polysaccharide biosynthesis transport protein
MFVIIPAIVVTILCTVGAYLLPNRYESSTTILVQREEIPNPLLGNELAAAMSSMSSEDKLQTFNEIIYSWTTLQMLADSLGLSRNIQTEDQRQALLIALERSVGTERRGSGSFRIIFTDVDPLRTQRGADIISNLFIETQMRVERARSEQAVQFFEKKLEELRGKFEASQRDVIAVLQRGKSSNPAENLAISKQMENMERQITDLQTKEKSYRQELIVLRTFPDALHTDNGKQDLYDLQRADLPFASDLRALLTKYDDYLRHYTPKYPEVQAIEKQILSLLERMKNAVETELTKLQPQQWDLEKKRDALIDQVRQQTITDKVDQDQESNYTIYRKLYDEMKVKLEQVEATRDLATKESSQYVVIDPARMPTRPSKPNRMQIILAGFGAGIFLGFLSILLKEMLDTTIRRPRDIEVYQKPVIAFISDGKND